MDSTRAYKFRIYPDATRQEEIDERPILTQQFYNRILEKPIASYQNGKTSGYKDLDGSVQQVRKGNNPRRQELLETIFADKMRDRIQAHEGIQ